MDQGFGAVREYLLQKQATIVGASKFREAIKVACVECLPSKNKLDFKIRIDFM